MGEYTYRWSQAFMLGIIIILLYLGAFFLNFAKSKGNGVLNSGKWLIWSYMFLVVVHVFSGIRFDYRYSFLALAYLVTNVMLLLTGEYLGRHTKSLVKLVQFEETSRDEVTAKVLAISAGIGAIFYISDIARLNGVNLGLRILNYRVSAIGQIGFVMLCGGLPAWLYLLADSILKNRRIPLLALLALAAYVSKDVINASRAHTMILLISSFVIFVWSRKKAIRRYKYPRRHLVSFLVIIGTMSLYVSVISVSRSHIENIESRLGFNSVWFGAKLSPEVAKALPKLGPIGDPIEEMLFYYSHELTNYSIYFDRYDAAPLFGLASFSYVTRRLKWLFGPVSEGVEKDVKKTFSGVDMSEHTWGTYAASFLIDYGRIGSLFMSLVFGWFAGRSRKEAVESLHTQSIVRQAIVCAGILVSIQGNPFAEAGWAYPLFWSMVARMRFGFVRTHHRARLGTVSV